MSKSLVDTDALFQTLPSVGEKDGIRLGIARIILLRWTMVAHLAVFGGSELSSFVRRW